MGQTMNPVQRAGALLRRSACLPSHLILQPAALFLLPALCKSLLLVAANSRQLTISMSAFTSGGILSEYEFRSRHSTSQLSSPNAVPLNKVRRTRSHFSLLSCSRRVKAAFRSSSLSARSIRLALFWAVACDEVRAHNGITNSKRTGISRQEIKAESLPSMFFIATVNKYRAVLCLFVGRLRDLSP